MEDFLLSPHDVVIFAERKLAFITLVAKQSHIILKMAQTFIELSLLLDMIMAANLSTISSALPDEASVVLIQEHLTLVALESDQMMIMISKQCHHSP